MARPPLRFAHEVLAFELVRPTDLASILDVSTAYVYKCIRCGSLRTTKIGSEHRIPQAEAVRYLESLGLCLTQHARSA